ncbi:hypothetical protein CIB48_g3461 [Xylaria polymorpha]|nr:hypothetical protein CIB48_g3461 [Xylaria polymorpha]
MAPDSTRSNDRPASSQHYTMKTSSRPTLVGSHSHHGPTSHNPRHLQSNLHSFRSNRASTPTASPRMPHSVGQPYPPGVKVSPNHVSDGRTPSPNYFGLSLDRHGDLGDSADAALQNNWSPYSSSVKSFGAAIPKQVPLDTNPEFEAFRRQVDANKANGFNLSGNYFAQTSAFPRPAPPRRPTNQSDTASDISMPKSANMSPGTPPGGMRIMLRFESPASTDSPFEPMRRGTLSKDDDRQSRLSLPHNKTEALGDTPKPRSETLPPAFESAAPGLLLPGELKILLQNSPESDYLLLDVRVATLYAQSRIPSALNLCIPTTLLKRATFNLEKLRNTLQTEEDQAKFGEWADVKHLIIYDNSSTEKRDATAAMNMCKKFVNEGFRGRLCLLKGGFQSFAAAYPNLIDSKSATERGGTSVASSQGGRPSFAPVIGGVALPSTANNPNPFFSNIRQNIDLADGVGQLDISVPPNLDSNILPPWLREATQKADQGKKVSDRFLNIERNEQSRMNDAYSAFNVSAPSGPRPGKVQLCGVEKGGKNRYKDILPFEHARDFWSVVWDQDVRVIVMLTAEEEGGQLKCHPYWQGTAFGQIRLKRLSEKKVSLDIDKYMSNSGPSSVAGTSESGRRRANTTTTFESPGGAPSQTQLQPQGDRALSQSSHLLAVVELANVMQRSALPVDARAVTASVTAEHPSTMSWSDEPESEARARPLLVHCSAGCGRTGAFCTVDSVIDMLKRQRLASLARRVRKDTDGDVTMGDRATSPKKAKHGDSPEELSGNFKGVDAGWVGETGLDLIEATVEDFRKQRLSMVQSLRQFVLCYESITEWVWRLQDRNNTGANTRGRLRSGSLQGPG